MREEYLKNELLPSAWKQQWIKQNKAENRFIRRHSKVSRNRLNEKLDEVIPPGLRENLDKALKSAFALLFEKGTGIIEKTYRKGKIINVHAQSEDPWYQTKDKDAIRVFEKNAKKSTRKNMAFSTTEGVVLGALGIGIPDIVLFCTMILKSIYEIVLHFGFSYVEEKEKILILKLIAASLSHGEELKRRDAEIDSWLRSQGEWETSLDAQICDTAFLLSHELLYMKFIQGIPIAGIIGGLSDTVYLKRITDYVSLKYQRRTLLRLYVAEVRSVSKGE